VRIGYLPWIPLALLPLPPPLLELALQPLVVALDGQWLTWDKSPVLSKEPAGLGTCLPRRRWGEAWEVTWDRTDRRDEAEGLRAGQLMIIESLNAILS
jgi:hypothetical protein